MGINQIGVFYIYVLLLMCLYATDYGRVRDRNMSRWILIYDEIYFIGVHLLVRCIA
jgi:hypothetical protein